MLDLDPTRDGPPPRDAATLVLLRDARSGLGPGIEVFCVERNKKSRFLGGAIVFPGGRVEDSDRDPTWDELSRSDNTDGPAPHDRAFAIAACRETLEEAALLVVDATVTDEDVRALRTRAETDAGAMAAFLRERHLRLDLRALVPLARWITPRVESRRFDTRFFVTRAPVGQVGAHDMSETMASFWESPAAVLARFDRSELQLAPPTHRTLMQLAACQSVEDALTMARRAVLEPICPELVKQEDTLALTLPGDPEHSVREARIIGPSRYVLRGEHWRCSM